jgi:hypothetical protein
MKAYIAVVSEPAPGVEFVSERELIVMAFSRGEAEMAFRAHVGNSPTPNDLIAVINKPPRPGYVEDAKLPYGVVKLYNP